MQRPLYLSGFFFLFSLFGSKLQGDFIDRTDSFTLNDVAAVDIRENFDIQLEPPFRIFLSEENPTRGYILICGKRFPILLTRAMYKSKGLLWLGRNDDGNIYVQISDLKTACG
jgi:hypothetical protein